MKAEYLRFTENESKLPYLTGSSLTLDKREFTLLAEVGNSRVYKSLMGAVRISVRECGRDLVVLSRGGKSRITETLKSMGYQEYWPVVKFERGRAA